MPVVNIKITREQEPVTAEQKARLIEGVTTLIAETIGRGPATTVVIIEEVDSQAYGIGGRTVAAIRAGG